MAVLVEETASFVNNAGTSSYDITVPSSTSGNLYVLVNAPKDFAEGITGISPGTWTLRAQNTGGSTSQKVEIWDCTDLPASTTTISVTLGGNTRVCARYFEISGTDETVSDTSSAIGTSTAPAAGTITGVTSGIQISSTLFANTTTTVSSRPTNDAFFNDESAAGSGSGIELDTVYNIDPGASDNNPTWGLDASRAWGAVSIVYGAASSGTTHTVNDTDDVGITDSNTREVTFNRSSTDNVGTTDTFTARPHLVTWNEFSSLTWGDVGQDSVDFGGYEWSRHRIWNTPGLITLDLLSSAGVTDTNTRDLTGGTVFTQDPIDPVGVTDTAVLETTFNRSQTENVGITETTSVASTFNRSQTEDVGVTEVTSLEVTFTRIQTEAVGITDSAVISLVKEVIAGFNVGITDTVSIGQGKGHTDPVGITDSIDIQRLLDFVDNVGITDSVQISFGNGLQEFDDMGITDFSVFEFWKGFPENVQIEETVSLDQSKGFVDNVGITDSFTIIIPIKQNNTDNIGITDTVDVLLEPVDVEVPELSLVDEKRDAAITYLVVNAGAVEADLRKLTINDIAHKYWSHRAGAMDNQARSILDHLVINGFGSGWDWLTEIDATP